MYTTTRKNVLRIPHVYMTCWNSFYMLMYHTLFLRLLLFLRGEIPWKGVLYCYHLLTVTVYTYMV